MYKPVKRVSREITDKADLDFILGLEEKDITASNIMDMFGSFNGKSRFHPYDYFKVPIGAWTGYKNGKEVKNKNTFYTTLGKWIYNVFFVRPYPAISEAFDGYIDEDLTKKAYGNRYEDLSFKLIEKEIPIEDYKHFATKVQFFMQFSSVLSPSYTNAMLTVSEELNKKKKQLIKENKEAIDKGDIYVIDKITKELLDYAKELLKDDPSMDMYLSGARGTWDNNFKNMFVMRGAVKDPDPTKGFNIITSNFVDGCSKEDYVKLANSLSAGPYARSNKTSMGGYWEKLFVYAFGDITLLEEGTDCGSKNYINFTITEDNYPTVMYNYIIEGQKLVELTSKNIHKYIGKTVKMRFSSMCKAGYGKVCNKCAGNFFYRLGKIKHVGLATQQVPAKIKLISMKLFHDDQVNLITIGKQIDPMRVFDLN